jgi:hypothetical protein
MVSNGNCHSNARFARSERFLRAQGKSRMRFGIISKSQHPHVQYISEPITVQISDEKDNAIDK